jgi:hypothetical protein
MNIILTGQSVAQDVVKELYGTLGNVHISIPVNDAVPLDALPILERGISYPEDNVSVVSTYNMYKKLARYIIEYVYWLFSGYIHSRSITTITNEHIQNFFKEQVVIDPNFEYTHVGKIFSLDSGVMRNGKLVVKSEETLKRLVYVLRVYINTQRQKLMNYHTRKVIEHYYVDITDFDHHQFQVILQGNNSVSKWIDEHKLNYYLYDTVQIARRSPYFFRNSLVGDTIYLAQNTDTIQKAIAIAETWAKHGYNPGSNPTDFGDDVVRMTLYRYVSAGDITPFKVNGVPTDLDIHVLGYKIEDMSAFTVLLTLG